MPLLTAFVAKNDSHLRLDADLGGWKTCYKTEHMIVWHRQAPASRLQEFRAVGTFSDISAMSFIEASSDVAFRRIWDKV
ncbi:unnamed protein product, partial [Phaeothamnion confervicola]